MLVNQLDARDSISMVVYAGASSVVLPPTRGNRKADILNALNQLQAGGSTNGAAGIELAHLRIRYKLPQESVSKLIEAPIMDSGINAHGGDSFEFAVAVAAFGQKLRGGKYLDDFSYTDIANLASNSRGKDMQGYRSEFLQLVNLAGTLDRNANVTHSGVPQDGLGDGTGQILIQQAGAN